MFTVIDNLTGKPVVVYAVTGGLFLVYDEQMDQWRYVHMNGYRPAKPEEVS